MIVVSCYFPPSLSDAEFMRDLHELEVRVREASGRPIIVLGDFNAPAWDPGQPNRNGKLLLE